MAENLPDFGEKLDAYLVARLRRNKDVLEWRGEILFEQNPEVGRIHFLAELVRKNDPLLARRFPFEPWQCFLALHAILRGTSKYKANRLALEYATQEIQRVEPHAFASSDDLEIPCRNDRAVCAAQRSAQRHQSTLRDAESWQKEADEHWRRNPLQTLTGVANRVAMAFPPARASTIRKYIKKPAV